MPRSPIARRSIGIVVSARAASYTGVHRSLLAGFCTMVGVRGEEGEYIWARAAFIFIFSRARRCGAASRAGSWPPISSRPRACSRAASRRSSRCGSRPRRGICRSANSSSPTGTRRASRSSRASASSFSGSTLSANRIVNYGPIAPEDSRLIFAREALVYQRLRRRPGLAAGERRRDPRGTASRGAAARAQSAAAAGILRRVLCRALPRQVSSAATLEHFTRHLSEAQRRALDAHARADIRAPAGQPAYSRSFPKR